MFITDVEIMTSVVFKCGHADVVLGYGADVESVIMDALEAAEDEVCSECQDHRTVCDDDAFVASIVADIACVRPICAELVSQRSTLVQSSMLSSWTGRKRSRKTHPILINA